MVPTMYGPATAAAATGANAATPTAAATTPSAVAAAAVGAAPSFAPFPSVPAVTGVPLNKVSQQARSRAPSHERSSRPSPSLQTGDFFAFPDHL